MTVMCQERRGENLWNYWICSESKGKKKKKNVMVIERMGGRITVGGGGNENSLQGEKEKEKGEGGFGASVGAKTQSGSDHPGAG